MRCIRSLYQNRAQQQLWFHELMRGENLENLGAVRTLPKQKCFRMKGKEMRIALVAPLAEAVPPKLYGGTERLVSWLAEELVRQGHKATLFASAGHWDHARFDSLEKADPYRQPNANAIGVARAAAGH